MILAHNWMIMYIILLKLISKNKIKFYKKTRLNQVPYRCTSTCTRCRRCLCWPRKGEYKTTATTTTTTTTQTSFPLCFGLRLRFRPLTHSPGKHHIPYCFFSCTLSSLNSCTSFFSSIFYTACWNCYVGFEACAWLCSGL